MLLRPEEQKQLFDGLKNLKTIFNANQLAYWLDFGTLLCAFRDGDLTWEHDIDLGIFVEDAKKLEGLKEEIDQKLNTNLRMWSHCSLKNPLIYSFELVSEKFKAHYDILPWYPVNDYRCCWGTYNYFSMPQTFFTTFSTLNFRKLEKNTYFTVPASTQNYIAFQFGHDFYIPQKGYENQRFMMAVANGEQTPYPANRPLLEAVYFRNIAQRSPLHIPETTPEVKLIEKSNQGYYV